MTAAPQTSSQPAAEVALSGITKWFDDTRALDDASFAAADGESVVIIGPSASGKTVALKTLGLCALLVRIGAFIPASVGSRVDLFPVITALIGDHQTVQGDHSSFSSHTAALRGMLDQAGRGALFLVDEIASGTDPQQGAALAHAVLEALVDRGGRGVITTHFHRLKTLGAIDPRFAMAGMQFADGRPTFRLVAGASGESHALSVAERMGMPVAEIQRWLAPTLAYEAAVPAAL